VSAVASAFPPALIGIITATSLSRALPLT